MTMACAGRTGPGSGCAAALQVQEQGGGDCVQQELATATHRAVVHQLTHAVLACLT